MQTNAISVANYLIDLAQEEGKDIRLLGLVKLVYFVHGISLAIFNKPAIDHRFDKVEAWKLGPVIPSVYHTFKYNRAEPIRNKGVIFKGDDQPIEPELTDKDVIGAAKAVWSRYKNYTDSQLVKISHAELTPWSMTYQPNENLEILDEDTKRYYRVFINYLSNQAKRQPDK